MGRTEIKLSYDFAPFEVKLSPFDVVQPDLVYVAPRSEPYLTDAGCWGPPDLVIEVLSPGTSRRDRTLKLREGTGYAEPELHETAALLHSPLFPGLAIPLADVFAP